MNKIQEEHKEKALRAFYEAGIALTQHEKAKIEIADFGLNDLDRYGVQLIVFENNEDYCAKTVYLSPGQICPEHRHPPVNSSSGKRETFRCLSGSMYLYVPGEKSKLPKATVPESEMKFFTVWNEIILQPGDQYTVPPNNLHWFQAGSKGVIFAEYSMPNTDEHDIFTNSAVVR